MPADSLRDLDRVPSRSGVFLWADYIELRCLAHPDGYFSLDGAAEALQEAEDYSADAETPLSSTETEALDKLERRWAECDTVLHRRADIYGDAYPFIPAEDYRGIELREPADHMADQWYRFMLLASALQYVTHHNQVTSAFEIASLAVFKQLCPVGTQVHGFWPGAHHYPHGKPDRIKKLASDIRAIPVFGDNTFNANAGGDAGIDLVAWHPLGDERNRIPVALAQCGCSVEEWKTKPTSTGRDKLNALIHMSTTDWWRFYFMPLDLTGPSGLWADGTDGDLPSVIVVDRQRLIRLATQYKLALPAEAVTVLALLENTRYS